MASIKELEEQYKENPEDAEICMDLGIAYGEENDFVKAIPLLQKATELAPDDPETHYNLATAYGMLLAADLEIEELWEDHTDEEELFELAINGYLRTLELDPNHVEALNNLGTLYVIHGFDEEAIKHWEKSLEIEPDQPDIEEDLEDLKADLEDFEEED